MSLKNRKFKIEQMSITGFSLITWEYEGRYSSIQVETEIAKLWAASTKILEMIESLEEFFERHPELKK